MKKLIERNIGNLSKNGVIPHEMFRATTAQKLVLKNMGSMVEAGRENIIEQDILNIPLEDLQSHNLTINNIEGAYETLVDLDLLKLNVDNTIELTDAGQKVLDNIKQFEPEDEAGAEEMPPEGGEELGAEGGEELGAEGGEELDLDLASFDLLSNLRDLSKFIRG